MEKSSEGEPAMKTIVGISLELQEKILMLIKSLIKTNHKMTGVILKVEDVGYGFCWGITDKATLEKSGEYFRANDLEYKFSVVEIVLKMSADHLMHRIHRYNDEANLPGILKYLESHQKAA